MPHFKTHFIIFEISRALDNDFQADCNDLFRFLIGLSIPKSFVFCICMRYNEKELFLFMVQIILSEVYGGMVTYMYVLEGVKVQTRGEAHLAQDVAVYYVDDNKITSHGVTHGGGATEILGGICPLTPPWIKL